MKKIALFSLLLCMFAGGVLGDEPVITQCGTDTCRTYDIGGLPENDICYREKKQGATMAADEEEWSDEWFVKKVGTDCTNSKRGAKKAVCIKNDADGDGNYLRSCAARQCDDNHILWLTNTRGQVPQSQGNCLNKESLNQWCHLGCDDCQPGQECVLKEYSGSYRDGEGSKTAPSYTKAFIGEDACHCVNKSGQSQSEETCDVFTNVTCPDRKISGYKKIGTLKKADIFDQNNQNPISCPDFENKINDNTLVVKTADGQTKNLRDAINEMMLQFCKKQTTGGETVVDSATNAHNRLQAFFNSKADVWKDAEGKFNTARLASDLTAGVVLGTVGGVVSGVVIKDKQVEKGFDALHCTVGGQTIADWGDEFIVGMSK